MLGGTGENSLEFIKHNNKRKGNKVAFTSTDYKFMRLGVQVVLLKLRTCLREGFNEIGKIKIDV